MGKQKRGQEISKGVVVPGLKGKHSHSGTNNGLPGLGIRLFGSAGVNRRLEYYGKSCHGHLGIYLEAVERVACLVLASCPRAHVRFLHGLGVGFDVGRFTW